METKKEDKRKKEYLELLHSGNRSPAEETIDDVTGAKVVEEPLAEEDVLEEDVRDREVSMAQHQIGGGRRRGGRSGLPATNAHR